MAKKNGKNGKDKDKKKLVKKAAKAPAKKPVKVVAKKAAAKKAAPAKPAKKTAAAPVKKGAKPAAKPAKAAAAPALKKGAKPEKPEKVVKGKPAEKQKGEKEAKGRVAEVEEAPELETAGEEEAEEVFLTDAEGRRFCRVKDCDQLSAVDGYCRYHYLALWKKIQVRKKILSEGKLERYIEELTARYPDKFLEMLRKDLRSEKEFLSAIAELEIDESAVDNEFEDEAQTYIDEVRGMGEPAAREEEDF